jgi:hypothetical protein
MQARRSGSTAGPARSGAFLRAARRSSRRHRARDDTRFRSVDRNGLGAAWQREADFLPGHGAVLLWVASRHLDNYEAAIVYTIRAGGDIDTNCAIVGGIVALAVGRDGIPADWLADREELVV